MPRCIRLPRHTFEALGGRILPQTVTFQYLNSEVGYCLGVKTESKSFQSIKLWIFLPRR
jgi:hypothetical protein